MKEKTTVKSVISRVYLLQFSPPFPTSSCDGNEVIVWVNVMIVVIKASNDPSAKHKHTHTHTHNTNVRGGGSIYRRPGLHIDQSNRT